MVRRRRGRRVGHGNEALGEALITIGVAVCCIPCICVIGGTVLMEHAYDKIHNYHRPATLRKMEQRRQDREFERRTPKNLAPRYGARGREEQGPEMISHLTIGRSMEEISPALSEDSKAAIDIEVEPETKAKRKSIFRDPLNNAKETPVVEKKAVIAVLPEEPLSPSPSKITNNQDDCLLLTKLPLEIRQQIYREAIGGYVFHIYFVDAYRRMANTRCKHSDPKICGKKECRSLFKQKGARDPWGASDLMALLKSCRIIYSEAIEILYKSNVFEFNNIEDVLRLSMTILPERMKLITANNVLWKIHNFHLTYQSSTPWLDCRAPESCSCIRPWIHYIWLMRCGQNEDDMDSLFGVDYGI
ncbi:hypothetical protein G7Y89_g7855 [Cudoniella acicularis]|uniref:DUF7730 domain-containing protein n=1 Tax=Cudoniella acicularis TaxID=354080 RepID=A0A8H4RJZ8_9HELO|nr:hypothetical protein G7Y89_g7855 [Cudoniella acicularis]